MIPVNSVVKLERKLDDSRILRAARHAHGSPATGCIGTIEIHVVEGIEKVTAELQPHSLGYWKILLQAQVEIRVPWTTYRSLRRAGSEHVSRICVRSIIEPLVADELAIAGIKGCFPPEGSSSAWPAIWAQSTAIGTSGVASSEIEVIQCQRKARVYGNDRVDRPTACHRIDHPIRLVSPALAVAERNFVNRIRPQHPAASR